MMLVSAKYLAALALLVYTVAARTTESDASSSAEAVAAAPKVDLEKVDEADNALINALEEEEKAVMDRIDALEDSIKTLTTMDVDKDLDTSINKTAQANVKPVQADKKKKKSKGKKPRLSSYQNYALAQPDTDSPLPVEGEEEDEDDEEYYDDEEESEEEELPQGDAPSSNSYDLMVSDGYVPDATLYRDYNRGRSNRGRPSALMSGQDKYFDVQPLDDYLKTCTDCYEHTEDNICPLSPVGLELKKWAGELEDILSHGCMKPNDCDLPGTCCLQREGVPVEPTVVRMTQMLKDVFEMVRRNCKNCKGRAEWSEWCAWSGCSATCGRSAVQTRTRKCVHRGPNDGGKPECEGDSVETKPCNLPSCCQPTRWSSWTPWGQCSGSCGMETVTRTRSCQNPNRNTFECPDECPAGSRMETKEVRCGPEPVDSRWGSWTQWNMAVTCGNGMATRSRNCNPGNRCGRECVGDSMEQQFQRGQPCPVCERTGWGEWQSNECSNTCGPGSRLMTRTCRVERRGENGGEACPDNPCSVTSGRFGRPETEEKFEDCNLGDCCVPQDAVWRQWSSWSSCTVSCGDGTVTRRRECDDMNLNSCGRNMCRGDSIQTKTTRCGPESEIGRYSSWGSWSRCSETCGDGQRTRRRTCSVNAVNGCSRACAGPDEEVDRCNEGACQPCQVRSWGAWSTEACSASCGRGMRSKSRYCEVTTQGKRCSRWEDSRSTCDVVGDIQQTEEACQERPCPIKQCERLEWGRWSTGPCSASCGQGTRMRSRTCELRERGEKCFDQYNLSTCQYIGETDQQAEPCSAEYNPRCCEMRQWTSWTSNDECSVTCGQGVVTKRRRCAVMEQGVKCYGANDPSTCTEYDRDDTATEVCNNQPCCEYREYRTWSPWGPCDVTCVERNGRPGTQQRARRCEVVSPGKKCSRREGDRSLCDIDYFNPEDIETRSCPNLPECPIPTRIEYAEWDAWCPCDCSTGKVSRRRACEEVDVYTGRRNPVAVELCLNLGDARETEDCDVRDHCPSCINSCESRHSLGDFLPDGNYQSCMGCADYISCRNGQATSFRCDKNGDKEFDAFIKKCVSKSSPSCALREPVTSCRGIADGSYHAKKSKNACQHYATCQDGRLTVNRCPRDMEWNDHAKECQLRRSPTCIRDAEEVITNSIEFSGRFLGVPRNDMPADAPADMFYDEEHGLSPEERRRIYEEERKELELTRAKDAKWEKENPLKASELKLKKAALSGETPKANKTVEMTTTDSVLRRMNPSDVCISGPNACKGLEPGHYASCRGCDHYAVCTKRGRLREKRCPKSREFDNNKRRCVRVSKTCKLQGTA